MAYMMKMEDAWAQRRHEHMFKHSSLGASSRTSRHVSACVCVCVVVYMCVCGAAAASSDIMEAGVIMTWLICHQVVAVLSCPGHAPITFTQLFP